YWRQWYGEDGYVPKWAGSDAFTPSFQFENGWILPRWDPLIHLPEPVQFVFYLLLIGAGLLTTIGLFTRPATIFFAIGLTALHHRNILILHGGDTVMRVMVFYLALAPSGRAFSVDALRRFKREGGRTPADPGPPVSEWPRRLIQTNMAIIYFTSTWGKYFGTYWKNGQATWFPARLNEFKRFPVPAFFNDLPMVYITTWGTLAVEFALAVLVWFRPCRKWALLSGLMLHGFIEYSMNIPLFSFLMMSLYVVWYDGEEISGWYQRLVRRFDSRPRKAAPVSEGGTTELIRVASE
ncbi:MAG: hypothetical protein C4320_01910, partial [Armatimonadota bacterium]